MLSKSDFKTQKWQTLDVQETAKELQGNVSAGLTKEEALRRNQLYAYDLFRR